MRISKNQARLYQLFKNAYVQQLLYGCGVFILIFGAFVFHSWYNEEGMRFSDTWERMRKLIPIFKEATLYTLAMAPPVYLNLLLFLAYRGRISKILGWEISPFPELKGWGFPIFIITSLIVSLTLAFPIKILLIKVFGMEIIPAPWSSVFIVAEFLTLLSIGAYYAKETIEVNRELERRSRLEDIRRRNEAEKRRKEVENELTFIKRQIRPHFLFNTLQNLKILALKKSDDLPVLIDQLSLLLRYLFTEANSRLVSLEKELDFIRGYVELERLSLSPNTQLLFAVNKGKTVRTTGKIAPMLLLNIVENCFKHYNKSSRQEKIITIQIKINRNSLTLATKNTFQPGVQNEHPPVDTGGVGLKTLTENLALVYGNQFHLKAESRSTYFLIQLKIPLL